MENKIKVLLEERRKKDKEEMKELKVKLEYLRNKKYARKMNKAITNDLERQIKRNQTQVIKALEKGDEETVRVKNIENKELLEKLIEAEEKDKYLEIMELRAEVGL